MEQNFTHYFSRLLKPLLLQLFVVVCFATQGLAQTELPIYEEGPWDALPSNWTYVYEPDYGPWPDNLGPSTNGGSAGFDNPTDALTVQYDGTASEVSYWLAHQYGPYIDGFKVYESASIGGNFTLLSENMSIPEFTDGASNSGAIKYVVNPAPTTRVLKFVYEAGGGVSIMLDALSIIAPPAVQPDINIKQGATTIASGNTYNFGATYIGSSNSRTFTIENLGGADLELTGSPIVKLSGANADLFSVEQPATGSVAANGSTTFNVTFNPTAFGEKSAILEISSDDPGEPVYTIDLAGTGEYAQPDITALSPATAGVGQTVTVTGTGFKGITTVKVGGVFASFSVVSDTEITLTVPEMAPSGPSTIRIENPGGYSDEHAFTVVTPDINLKQNVITIASGSTFSFGETYTEALNTKVFTIENLGGADLELTGSPIVKLSGANADQFSVEQPATGSVAANGSTTFNVTFNPTASGEKSAILEISSDDPDEPVYTISIAGTGKFYQPDITALSPATAVAGQTVTVTGTGFRDVTTVKVGELVISPFSLVSDTEITFTLPELAQNGPSTVRVENSDGFGDEQAFTVVTPRITGISPTSGTINDVVTINGMDFPTGRTPTFSVYFNGTTSKATLAKTNTSTQIQVKVPTGAQTGPISIMFNTNYTAKSTTFTVTGPTITGFTPGSGKEGTVITITGTGYTQNSSVYFAGVNGSVQSTGVQYVSSTAIKATVPTGAVTGVISVTNEAGLGQSTTTFIVERPTITVTGALSEFTTDVNTSSASQTYTVSGTYLEGGITVAGPASLEFKVSLDNTNFTRTLSVPLEAGATSIGETTIYVRYEPAEAGPHSATITQSSPNATAVTLAANGSTSKSSLPVELISFKAEKKADEVTLLWATASEKDNSHFEVEIAANPEAGFTRIGKVHSKAGTSSVTTNYLLKYNLTSAGTHYFRLKQVDLDGTATYSNVVAVEIEPTLAGAKVVVAPNPLNYNSKVVIAADADGKASLVLQSMAGKQLYQKTVAVTKGQNEVQLPLYDQLRNGLYILTVELQGQRHQVKVVKQ